MANLLSIEEKNMIGREYKRRLTSVYLLVSFFVLLVAMIFFIPLASDTYSKAKQVELEITALGEKDGGDYASLEKLIKQTKKEMDIVKQKIPSRFYASDLLTKILDKRMSGILLDSFSFSRVSTVITMVVDGQAKDRDILRKFVGELKGDPSFASVELPVSSFAKSEDIDFSVTIKLSTKKDDR